MTFGVVAAAVLFVLSQLQPSLLLANTTPSGGDMGAQVWGPAFMRDHILPKWRLSGWAPDWYAGFPAYTFYFPLPALLIVALDLVVPYGIAFKLVSVSGILSLPVAAYAFGRLTGMRFPGPALLAVFTIPFLFFTGYSIYGGNITSTLAGEFSFSIGLSLALVFLGVVARGLETGRHRALSAGLLALTGLAHFLPAIFAIIGAIVFLLLHAERRRRTYLVTVFTVGGLLGGFWWLPFLLRMHYVNDLGWLKETAYVKNLFPAGLWWVIALALGGAIYAVRLRRRTGMALLAIAVMIAFAVILIPEGRLWNARLLPFWYLSLHLLGGVSLAEVAQDARRELAARNVSWARSAPLAAPVLAALVVWVIVARPLGAIPSWVPVPATDDRSLIPGWVQWNYSGYERKDAYPEYKAIIDTMAEVGRTRGCGRAMWEYESELDRFGTPMALMLLPYWTDGCIDSMEGLHFEASATTPYHFLNQAELSSKPSNPQRNLPYVSPSPDVDAGVRHLQLLGVRYYLAFSPKVLAQARANPDLRLIARPVGDWHLFEVVDSQLVRPLSFEPAVLTDDLTGPISWLDLSVKWYEDPSLHEVPLAASGPMEWPRVAVHEQPTTSEEVGAGVALDPLPREPVTPTTVGNIRAGTDRISFDVDRPGSPVLVRTSYFPNWKAVGAEGPWRVTPNLMVVVPTAEHVELYYGWTPVDLSGWVLTFAGLLALAVLARRPPVELPVPPPVVARRAREHPLEPGVPAAAAPVGEPGEEPVETPEPREPVPLGAAGEAPAETPDPREPVPVAPAREEPSQAPSLGTRQSVGAAAPTRGPLSRQVAREGQEAERVKVSPWVVASNVLAYDSNVLSPPASPSQPPGPADVAPPIAEKRLVSVIVPVYNEAENIPHIYEALQQLQLDRYRFEFIFVDDGSSDSSPAVLYALEERDSAVRVIELVRNFGKEVALTAGLHAAQGEAAIMVDADLQHPPSLIPEFLAQWEQGVDVVVGVRRNQSGDNLLKRAGSALFYWMLNRLSNVPVTPRATDFRLLDRAVVDEFNRFSERGRITRGLIDWLGFRRSHVYFDAPPRSSGRATYSYAKLIRLALDSVVSMSLVPLMLAGYLGATITLLAGFLGLFILIEDYVLDDPLGLNFSGPAALGVLILFLVGIVLVCLGLMALYIGKIHAEVANRPLYVARRTRTRRHFPDRPTPAAGYSEAEGLKAPVGRSSLSLALGAEVRSDQERPETTVGEATFRDAARPDVARLSPRPKGYLGGGLAGLFGRVGAPPTAPDMGILAGRLAGLLRAPVAAQVALIVLLGVWAATFLVLGWLRHARFGTFGFDLGIFDQGVWLLSQGREAFVTVRGLHIFGNHASFVLTLLAPFYWVGGGPHFLLGVQVFSLALGAVFVYLLARQRLGNRWLGVAVAAALLLHPSYQFLAWEHFQPETLAVGPLLLAYWAARGQRWGWYAIGLVAALACKENVALAVIVMGLLVAYWGHRRIGLLTSAGAALYFVFAVQILIPAFAGGGPFYEGFFPDFGNSLPSAVWGMLTHPERVIEIATRPDRLRYLWQMFAPFGLLLPLLGLPALLVGGPQLLVNLLGALVYQHEIKWHHASLVLVGLILATVEGLALLREWAADRRSEWGLDPRRVQSLATVGVALAAFVSTLAWGPSPLGSEYERGFWTLGEDSRLSTKRAAVALVPPEAGVSASYYFVPHLTHRPRVYEFPVPWTAANWGLDGEGLHDPARVSWLVVDRSLLGEEDRRRFEELLDDEFSVQLDRDGIVVAQRVTEAGSTNSSR